MKTRRTITRVCACARLVALSILFGGSSAIVFAAITFVKAARLKGMTIAQAASYNAPIFVAYSKIAMAAAIVLAIAEWTGYFLSPVRPKPTFSQAVQFGAEGLCLLLTLAFALGIVPAMERLMPLLVDSASAYEAFHKLHHTSEAVFGCMIIFALVSLVTPVFKE